MQKAIVCQNICESSSPSTAAAATAEEGQRKHEISPSPVSGGEEQGNISSVATETASGSRDLPA